MPPLAAPPEVEIPARVLQAIRRHARSSMEAEICGVLIGVRAELAGTRVTACIAGESALEAGAHVTFTQETWEHIYKIKDAEYAEQSIVGWYHSHPGFGIFLSEYDLFIHQNFFSAPHQIAWVFDPHSDDEGCFGWVAGEIRPLDGIRVALETTPALAQQGAGEALSPPKADSPQQPAMAPTLPSAGGFASKLPPELLHALIWLVLLAAGIAIGAHL